MRYPLSSLALFPRLLRARPVQFRPESPTRTSCRQLRLRRLHTSKNYRHEVITQTHNEKKTVYALSTPPGRAGVAVVRISGPNALDVYHSMVITSNEHPGLKGRAPVPKPWHMERCSILDVQTQETLDDGLAVFFKGIPTPWPSSPNLMSLLLSQVQNHLHQRMSLSCIFTPLGRSSPLSCALSRIYQDVGPPNVVNSHGERSKPVEWT
jgi:hypothetical protein